MVWNFSWVVPELVGGMGWPGRGAAAWLREQGVRGVLSLTERLPEELKGLDVRHLPVADMTSPSLDELLEGVEYMRSIVALGGGVVAQCAAGLGRTGTFLAAYLVGDGMGAKEAIEHVRLLRPGSIETRDQERVIRRYAELIGGGG